MPTITDDAKTILERFKNAADAKIARCGDWYANEDSTDDDSDLSANVMRDLKMTQAAEQLEALESQFEESLTQQQKELRDAWQNALANPDLYDETETQTAETQYKRNLSDGQKEDLKSIEILYAQLQKNDYREFRNFIESSGRPLSRPILEVAVPPEMTDQQAYIAQAVLDYAISAALIEKTQKGDNLGMLKFHYSREDRKFAIEMSGDCRPITMGDVANHLEDTIPKLLQDDTLWERVNTTRGVGYCIRTKHEDNYVEMDDRPGIHELGLDNRQVGKDAMFEIVRAMVEQKYANSPDCQLAIVVDGVPMTENQYYAEWQYAARAAEKDPRHRVEEQMVLTGNAAKEIFAMLGVEAAKIKASERVRE